MVNVFRNWQVSDGTVRLILLRVAPSYEIEVGRQIESRSLDIGLVRKDFRVFRLFGSYDLVYIQDNASLTTVTDFVRLGTIPYVIGVSEYVCYKWVNKSTQKSTFSMQQIFNPLLGLCFLKVNPLVIQQSGLRPEIEFADYIRKNLPDVQMVGTLGWFEIAILLSKRSLSDILEMLGQKLPNLIYGYQTPNNKNGPLFFSEKTLTLLGHELDVSDTKSKNKGQVVNLSDKKISKKDLSVHFSISCRPQAMDVIEKNSINHFMVKESQESIPVNIRFGSRDLDFTIPLDEIDTLNQLLYKLDQFRLQNNGYLIKTYTDIQYNRKNDYQRTIVAGTTDIKGFLMFEITMDQAKQLIALGPEGAAVASAVYRYNNLTENAIVADAFIDLLKFVKVTRDLTSKLSGELSVSVRSQILDRLKVLKEAIDHRSQGVYVGIEEAPFSLGFTGIGLIRVLKALEAYVTLLLKHLSTDWNGFVLCGNYARFEHQSEVITIPSESGLSAKAHWAIIHEIMHVFQFTNPEKISPKVIFPASTQPVIERYRTHGSPHWPLLHEITADVLNYALFCPLPLDKYLKIIWQYLFKTVCDQQNMDQMRAYLFRSLAVICYEHSQTKKNLNPDWLDPSNLKVILKKYGLILEKNTPIDHQIFSVNDKGYTQFDLFIQSFIAEVGPALPYLIAHVKNIGKGSKRKCSKQKITKILKELRDGGIIEPSSLQNPEEVAWHLACDETLPFPDKSSMAWILSLWHLYHVNNLGINLRQHVRKK